MKQDAEEHAAEDEKRAALVDAKNKADSLVAQTRRQLEELGDKLPAEEKEKIEAELKKVEEAAKSDDQATIESAIEDFTKVAHKMAEALYGAGGPVDPAAAAAAAAGGPAPGPEASSEADSEDVIDADYEVKS
jgi:molecular chaperone DnaK